MVASGSQMTRSASQPDRDRALGASRPASRAGAADIHSRETCRTASPRAAAPVQTAGEPDLQRRDAAPGAHEVAVVEVLQRRRRRRMIGRDEIDLPGGQRPPQTARGDRAARIGGAHLNAVAPSANVLGGERQVVRAGLDASSARPSARAAPSRRQRVGATRGGRCGRAPVLARQPDQQLDRGVLGVGRPAVEPGP